jgi:hypothetical protein
LASTIRTAQHGTVRFGLVCFVSTKTMLSGDVTTLKRKPDVEVKIKPESSEPIHKKAKDACHSAIAASEELPVPVLPEVKKEKKKKKAKSYFDDL